jgi:hypothetical protein
MPLIGPYQISPGAEGQVLTMVGGVPTWTDGATVNIGEIRTSYAQTAPSKWLECDNSEVLQATYPDLYAAIGGADWAVKPPFSVGASITLTDLNVSASTTWVKYVNGLWFAALFNETGQYYTSTDGIAWTSRTMPTASSLMDVDFGAGVFVACMFAGGACYTSATGTGSWTSRTLSTNTSNYCVKFANSIFVLGGADTTTYPAVWTSSDGTVWTKNTNVVVTNVSAKVCAIHYSPVHDAWIAATNASSGTFICSNNTATGTWTNVLGTYGGDAKGGCKFVESASGTCLSYDGNQNRVIMSSLPASVWSDYSAAEFATLVGNSTFVCRGTFYNSARDVLCVYGYDSGTVPANSIAVYGSFDNGITWQTLLNRQLLPVALDGHTTMTNAEPGINGNQVIVPVYISSSTRVRPLDLEWDHSTHFPLPANTATEPGAKTMIYAGDDAV